MTKDNLFLRQKEIEDKWNRLTPCNLRPTPYPVWQYLQKQNVEALVNHGEKFLNDVRLASSLKETTSQIAFAVRDCEGNLVNILMLEVEGHSLANAGKQFRLAFDKASIAGASVHFGEPEEALGIAIGVESAMALVIATDGVPCWACLGPTCLRTLQVPEKVRDVRIFCDIDPSGAMEEAAAVLAARLQTSERKVSVLMPPRAALGLSGSVRWQDAWLMAGNRLLLL